MMAIRWGRLAIMVAGAAAYGVSYWLFPHYMDIDPTRLDETGFIAFRIAFAAFVPVAFGIIGAALLGGVGWIGYSAVKWVAEPKPIKSGVQVRAAGQLSTTDPNAAGAVSTPPPPPEC